MAASAPAGRRSLVQRCVPAPTGLIFYGTGALWCRLRPGGDQRRARQDTAEPSRWARRDARYAIVIEQDVIRMLIISGRAEHDETMSIVDASFVRSGRKGIR